MQRNSGKQALVLGAGVTGIATARFLLGQGFVVTVADNRSQPPGKAELAKLLPAEQLSFGVSLEGLPVGDLDCLVVSPGLPRSLGLLEQARNSGVTPVSDIELFLQQADAPVIAVTGTNGKSTVVTMIEHLLRVAGKRVLA
ncbi:MAG: UDP-N-acetylmuramoyl-L-alanine--D-glutamate ligase, partial [Gammaproteobacteria bacterium]